MVKMTDFDIARSDRKLRKGGGTAIYVREGIPFEVRAPPLLDNEAEATSINLPSFGLALICMYIPPSLTVPSLAAIRDEVANHVEEIWSTSPDQSVIIVGDFNHFDVNRLSNDLGLTDIITKATRGKNILDHVLISQDLKNAYSASNVSYLPPIGKSDHLTLAICPSYYTQTQNNIRWHKVYDFRASNLEYLTRITKTVDWKAVENANEDVDVHWSNLHNQIMAVVNECLPQKYVPISPNDKSWMTPLTKLLLNEKWEAFRASDWTKYHFLKQKVSQEIKKAKKLWATKLKGSTNGLWRLTKHLSGKLVATKLDQLVQNYASPRHLAEKIAEGLQGQEHDQIPYPSAFEDGNDDDDWNVVITPEEVERQLAKLPPNKAMGSDQIPNKIYAILAPFIATPLTSIYMRSISQRKFPSAWKSSIIIPIPKTQPPSLEKIRTISLLPSPAKIFERLVLNNISKTMEQTFGDCQHGFRKKTSTTTALIHILETVTTLFDDKRNRSLAVLSLDFTKAFDKVDHEILLQKLTMKHLPTGFLLWLKSYLADRRTRVKVQGELSDTKILSRGVPQGSVLGPSLFCSLVGDLSLRLEGVTCIQYADDVNIILGFDTENADLIKARIDKITDLVEKWCQTNGQELNRTKTALMLIKRSTTGAHSPSMPLIPTQATLTVLGVKLNHHLTWDDHVEYMCKKGGRRLHVLRTLRNFVSKEELHEVYIALIRSLLEYCSPAFIKLNTKLSKRLQRIENRAHRIIYGENKTCECGRNNLEERRFSLGKRLLQTMLQYPQHILKSALPNVLPRSKKLSNYVCRTEKRKNSFLPYVTILFNED